MQIWLKRKTTGICVILSQPKCLHCKVMRDKGMYSLLRGGGAAFLQVWKAMVTHMVLALTLESFTCTLL